METCVMCRSKVQLSENWIRCHLWGVRDLSLAMLRRLFARLKARNESRARSGKPAVTVNHKGSNVRIWSGQKE
jgi:hypothetical protein